MYFFFKKKNQKFLVFTYKFTNLLPDFDSLDYSFDSVDAFAITATKDDAFGDLYGDISPSGAKEDPEVWRALGLLVLYCCIIHVFFLLRDSKLMK